MCHPTLGVAGAAILLGLFLYGALLAANFRGLAARAALKAREDPYAKAPESTRTQRVLGGLLVLAAVVLLAVLVPELFAC